VNTQPEISCAEFDEDVDELAVGTLGEPERSRLLAHAARCPGCEAELNWLAGLADRLLLLVPEVEPPAGFEAGVMARMGVASTVRPVRKWRRRTWQLVGAAALALAVLAAGIAVGRTTNNRSTATALASYGEVWTLAGADIGAAQVFTKPAPHVLITLRDPLPWGVLTCQLELAHGQPVTVGSWNYQDSDDGTWAVQIDHSLVGAVMMRIINQQGVVVAKATLT
jgi:hypothetical protein